MSSACGEQSHREEHADARGRSAIVTGHDCCDPPSREGGTTACHGEISTLKISWTKTSTMALEWVEARLARRAVEGKARRARAALDRARAPLPDRGNPPEDRVPQVRGERPVAVLERRRQAAPAVARAKRRAAAVRGNRRVAARGTADRRAAARAKAPARSGEPDERMGPHQPAAPSGLHTAATELNTI